MSSTPDPARLADYQARLALLIAAKDAHLELNHDHHVKNLNRQIRAQRKWIASAEAAA
jgi:hypothetical protein